MIKGPTGCRPGRGARGPGPTNTPCTSGARVRGAVFCLRNQYIFNKGGEMLLAWKIYKELDGPSGLRSADVLVIENLVEVNAR